MQRKAAALVDVMRSDLVRRGHMERLAPGEQLALRSVAVLLDGEVEVVSRGERATAGF